MDTLTILELESCLNLNQILIDDVVRASKINSNINSLTTNTKLTKFNKQRDKIIKQIEKKLDEMFS